MSVIEMDKEKIESRKITQTGNSWSVTIPKYIIEQMDLEKGKDIEWVFNKETGEVKMRKKVNYQDLNINPKLLKSMDRTMNKYKGMFENLKDR